MFIITPDETVIGLDQTRFYPDAFTAQSYDLTWSKPSHPVANGTTKSDGIFKAPRRVTLSGCVAGVSLNKQGADPFEGEPDRTVAACRMIEAIGDARDCVTVSTGDGKIYQDMILIAAPIRFDVGGVMSFDLQFEELQAFAISETFDASLGEAVNIGEVSTQTGQPTTPPVFAGAPITDQEIAQQRIDILESQPQTIDQCTITCGVANKFCLDSCYGSAFQQLSPV